MDSRGKLLDSASVVPGDSAGSELIERVLSDDPELRMPKGDQLSTKEITILRKWIDTGVAWEPGFTFKEKVYKAKLKPRRPELPTAVDGREHAVDRFVDAYFVEYDLSRSGAISDAAFLRRASLDLTGELPSEETLMAFRKVKDTSKRDRAIDLLLRDSVAYADHWICLLYTSPSPRDLSTSRMPSSA